MSCLLLEYRNSEAVLDDESERISPLDVGLLSLNSCSTFGSIVSSGRSSQPRLALYCARASLVFSLRPI